MLIVSLFAIGVALLALWASARAAVTVGVLEIREGKVRVVRGWLAPSILSDIRDVAARPPIGRATLRIARSKGRAVLELRGEVSEAQRQQLRNVVGSVPLAKLASGRRR